MIAEPVGMTPFFLFSGVAWLPVALCSLWARTPSAGC